MNEPIYLNEVLKKIDAVDANGKALPFDITVRSLNRNSKTGGKKYDYKGVRKYRKKKYTDSNFLKAAQAPAKRKRNPNHFKNRTRNIELQNGDIKTIRIRLIISFNGQKVIY